MNFTIDENNNNTKIPRFTWKIIKRKNQGATNNPLIK